MRDPNRIDVIINAIEEIWKKNPNLRLCQLIGNCFPPGDIYQVEDAKLINNLKKVYKV